MKTEKKIQDMLLIDFTFRQKKDPVRAHKSEP